MEASAVTLTTVPGIPLVEPGDDLAALLIAGLRGAGLALRAWDVVVVAQKIVSKAEGRYIRLADVVPGARAAELARQVGKDPRHVQAILDESSEIVRYREGVLVTGHRLGFVMANAGIDQSNIDQEDEDERILLLPSDPDASCAALKRRLDEEFGAEIAVVMNDSFGRPWRNGVVGVALGAAGLPSLVDLVGRPDLFGRPLRVTQVALADEIAAAASLLMGQADEGRPAVLVRGLSWSEADLPATALVRPRDKDLFR